MRPFMKEKIHPKYVDAEIRCACGNVIKTRSTKPVIIVGICNACHPFLHRPAEVRGYRRARG